MYDLTEVIAQNNLAAVWAMMRGEQQEAATRPEPKEWPLSWLAEKLMVGPPVLSEITNGLIDITTQQNFIALIRDYLPTHEEEILAARLSQRVRLFCYYWGQERYPLPEGASSRTIEQFVSSVPVQLMGLSYEAYHELDFRPSYLALLSLVCYPFEGDVRDYLDDEVPYDPFETDEEIEKWQPRDSDVDWLRGLLFQLSDGGQWMAPAGFIITKLKPGRIKIELSDTNDEARHMVMATVKIAKQLKIEVITEAGKTAEEKILRGARLTLLEKLQELVGPSLVSRIRKEGWDPGDLHRAVDGTEYEGLGYFADWALGDTRCLVLDTDYGDVEFKEGYAEPAFKWTRHNIDNLTEQWPRVREYREKIDTLANRLDRDLEGEFGRLLDFLVPVVKAEAPERLYDTYGDHPQGPALDTVSDEEEEDGD
jgi:hypothetical protein